VSPLLTPHHKTLSQEQLPSFQIVKEQPIVSAIPRGITNQVRVAANLIAVPSIYPGAGGANRDRTDDLLLAKQALSQLSYGPINRIGGSGKS
jgi:hypothetical protein